MPPAQQLQKGRPPGTLHTALDLARSFAGVAWLTAGLLAVVATTAVCLLNLPKPWAVAILAVFGASLLLPLRVPPPAWARRFCAFSIAELRRYFPITIVYEDKDAVSGDGPFVIAYEPHSVLPLGLSVFTTRAAGVPRAMRGHVAVTSTLFLAPFVRHMAWWMGFRSASRESLQACLEAGESVSLCPGGVAECFHMSRQPDREFAYLRSRTGFVRLAMQTGAAIVPVFAFGQTPHYSFWRPFIDSPRGLIPSGAMASFVRRIGFVPMLVWGAHGTALPHRIPMHVVCGAPIQVPRVADPSPQLVQQYLQQYIAALQALFDKHKAAAGHARASLTIL